MSDKTVLPVPVVDHQADHAGLHTAERNQINHLTQRLAGAQGILTGAEAAAQAAEAARDDATDIALGDADAALASLARDPSSEFGSGLAASTAHGASVLDFRVLPNGNVDSIRATRGKFVALSSADRTPYSVSGGRLKSSAPSTCYLRVRAPGGVNDRVQHVWAVVRFNTTTNANEGPLFVLPQTQHDSTTDGPGTSGVHALIRSRFVGNDAGLIHAEGYQTTGTKTLDGEIGFTLPGKTVRWDLLLDQATGRQIHLVNGSRVLDFIDAAVPAYTSRDAIFQFGGTAVEVVEFGASCDLPALTNPGVYADNGYFPEVALATANLWYRIASIKHTYDASGVAMVTWDPYIRTSGGDVFMVAASYDSMDYTPFYKPQLSSGPVDHRVPFRFRRTGTPGTTERIGIWAMCTNVNAATINPGTVYSLEPTSEHVNTRTTD